tara:strand:+ start:726 stop:1286 length:561 start_codon:yes stop_codon:yes gene_type:complete
MPTVIVRPDAISSSTGWNLSGTGLQEAISDGDISSTAIQSNATCVLTCTFNNDGAYSGGTINSMVVSAKGGSTGRGTPTADLILYKADETVLEEVTLTFAGAASTQTGGTITEDSEGEDLEPSTVDGMFMVFDPSSTGMFLAELLVTVDYTAAASGYGHQVNGVAAASISSVIDVATANISTINNV